MSQEQPLAAVVEPSEHLFDNQLLKLFDEMTFLEKWERVMEGLKQPPDTGEYKFAKLQILRLWAPASAVIVTVLTVLILFLISRGGEEASRGYEVVMQEPEKMEEKLEDIQPEPPPPDQPPPEPTEIVPTDVAAPSNANMPGPPGPSVPFSPQPTSFDTVAMVKSPIVMRGIYAGRSPGSRGSLLGRGGGGSWTEDAVLKALRWLKKNQNEDGSWPQTKPAATSFALLTYLAHGETPTSEEFGYTVEKAIRFLIESQGPDGRFRGRDGHDYTQPIAAYALCEAYGMTKVPQIRYAAQKAIAEVIKGQNPSGGFNYNLVPNGSDRDDTSYMAWCAQALKAADIAGVMDEPDTVKAAMRKAIKGFQKNYGANAGGDTGYASGGFGYTGPGPNHGLTGAGALCMQLLGAAKEKEVRGAIQTMEAWKFEFGGKDTGSQIYYAYYGTQAKFHEGGEVWKKWNAQCAPSLVKGQTVVTKAIEDTKGKLVDIGYWEMASSGMSDGLVMQTCLCTLMLEVYYRYLPTFQTPQEIDVAAPAAAPKKDEVKVEVNI